ncbi:MAG TPA: ABC transporter ATP-binding protein [Clostridia bacterium]|nr:ABC transporter ATP-binding protein [Clostridia bacterium]
MSNSILSINNVSKRYAQKSNYAIQNISFDINEGEIVGILGHNGAGKSTTLKCITGMLPFERGEIKICGHSIKSEPLIAKQNFGFVSDNHAVFERMTGREYLNFLADIYSVEPACRDEKIEEFQQIFHLGNSLNYIISSYSHGMKQKICLMGSILHQPKLWILDEPLTGLDAKIAQALKSYIKTYQELGNTIIFSTHNLDVIEKVCTRAIFIINGKLTHDIIIEDYKKNNSIPFEEFALEHIGG